jgi:hypothetical protein
VLVHLTGYDLYGLVTQIDDDGDVDGDDGLVYLLLDETLRVREIRAPQMHDPVVVVSLIDYYQQLRAAADTVDTRIQALSAIANFLGPRLGNADVPPDPRD